MLVRIRMDCLIGVMFQSIILKGMYPRIRSGVFGWIKAHGTCSTEFEELGAEICVFVRTWEGSTFRRVCVAVLIRCISNTTSEATELVQNFDAGGLDVTIISIFGGHTYLQKSLPITWAVGTVPNSWNYPYLIFDCASVASSGLPHLR